MQLTTNQGKNLTIQTSVGTFSRYAIPTHFVQIGENYIDLIQQYITPVYRPGDIISISEKIISLCQKRIIYKKDMKLSRLAKLLSRFASHSSAGIGVDCVWKMQFALNHCGTWKILYATLCSAIGKLFGKHGIFYDIAGEEVRGLDGFYDKSYSVYGDFGIRLPENPDKVCEEIYEKTGVMAMIVDANDFTRDILGTCSAITYTRDQLAQMIQDNPSGQSTQQTPFVIIRPAQ